MRKICAQEEEDDVEYVEESLGSSSDPSRAKSSEKRLMTQISLTILPCSSTVSLCAIPFQSHFTFCVHVFHSFCTFCTHFSRLTLLHLMLAFQDHAFLLANLSLRHFSQIFASLAAV
jgi:hypothetical protein